MMKDSELQKNWDGLLFDVRRSIRYHNRRRAFFDRLVLLGDVLALVFGSATIYGVLQENAKIFALIAAAIVTILSSINLVVGSSQKARLHYDLVKRFIKLERLLLAEPSEDIYKRAWDKRLSIEADEPPVLRVLDAICYNELVQAEGLGNKYKTGEITWVQQRFCQIMDINFDKIAPPSTDQA